MAVHGLIGSKYTLNPAELTPCWPMHKLGPFCLRSVLRFIEPRQSSVSLSCATASVGLRGALVHQKV